MTSLLALGIQFNQLEGSLPEQWSTMSALSAFDAANNQLTGTLPAAYAHAVTETTAVQLTGTSLATSSQAASPHHGLALAS